MEEPPKKYFRMFPGNEVRLMNAYFVKCTGCVKDADGRVVEIHCTYDPASRGGNSPDGRKVKGTIHWLSCAHSLDTEVRLYDKLFTEYNHIVAQILITAPDLQEAGSRKRNFHNTLARLLELGALPVINENDTVSTDEIVIGDNDTLSANVASTIGADLLVLLSDIDGLYDSDPHKNPSARLIDTVEQLDERIYALAGGEGSSLGTGGMVTKLRAAKIATDAGCEMVIANGSRPENLYDILDGAHVGTRFLAQEEGK